MPTPIPIAIYVHRRVSPAFIWLIQTIFESANHLGAKPAFAVRFVTDRRGLHRFGCGLTLRGPMLTLPRSGYLFIPPLKRIVGSFHPHPAETQLIQKAHARGLTIATACLASFMVAATGLLEECEATTHWRWFDYAQRRFPLVRWNPRLLISETPKVLTAGGLLATVDLALHIVGRHGTASLSRELGRHLLADSNRQKQSLYATRLIRVPRDQDRFADVEAAIDANLSRPPSVPEMARLCHLSVRSFHRHFAEKYGVPPGKFVQLRRIECAKTLLSDETKSLWDVAAACGFSQLGFFSALFARETGQTPVQFRRSLKIPVRNRHNTRRLQPFRSPVRVT